MAKWAKVDRKLVAAAVVAVLVLLFVLIQAPGFIRKEKPSVRITGEFPERKSGETMSVQEMQRAVNTAPALQQLGADAKILILFYDGSGAEVGKPRFMVDGGGAVTEITGLAFFDIAIATGDYYINEIKSTNDICELWKRLESNQDLTVQVNVDSETLQSRYAGLSECVPFS